MHAAERGGVTPIHLGDAAEPQRLDVLPQQRPRLRAVVDEQAKRSAARDRLDAERAGAGEQVEHPRIADGIAIGMRENVEQRLAQAVGGRPDLARGRARDRAPAQSSADDAHRLLSAHSRESGNPVKRKLAENTAPVAWQKLGPLPRGRAVESRRSHRYSSASRARACPCSGRAAGVARALHALALLAATR